MARKKISEFRAKTLLSEHLDKAYKGVTVGDSHPFSEKDISSDITYVIKVDEGVKKRMKQGLVFLNKSAKEIPKAIDALSEKGYTHFIIEPFVEHEKVTEKYLSFALTREGVAVLYSEKGGIDIEENQDSIKNFILTSADDLHKVKGLDVDEKLFASLFDFFKKYHFTLLEINPLVISGNELHFLDIAAEVDSAAEFFINGKWTSEDFREGGKKDITPEEIAIDQLKQKSQASFKLDVLNKNGAIFMLLSGGGASIALADEVYNLGYGKQLANYGEYSGNPNTEEVYLYTKNLLQLLLKSNAPKKVLVIGGGVANFTDIRHTFAGIIKSIEEVKAQLKDQNVKVFVRRGGPHQKEGLAKMKDFLENSDLLGSVSGPELPLPEIITLAVKTI